MNVKSALTVIMPACNEQENIGRVLEKIKKITPRNTEIIVVDDGSTDNTMEIAKKKGAKVIRHSKNMGKGASIREAIIFAKADTVIIIDSDGQDDPFDIPKLLLPLKDGGDLVIGSRWLGVLEEEAISKLHFFVTMLITQLINILFGSKITDSQAGFRCIRRDAFKNIRLTAKGYDIETEMLVKAIKHKLRIVEVPVTRRRREYGMSKLKRVRLGIRILNHLVREKLTS